MRKSKLHMNSSTSPLSYKISFSKADRSSEYFRNVQSLRLSMELIDVVLVFDDGVEIPAHRVVLASASPYFRTMFKVNMRESGERRVLLGVVDSASVKALVDFAYTGEIDVISDNDVALFSAAHRLLFDDVVDYCCEGLANRMNKSNCLRWLEFADQYNCQKLLSVADRHVAFHIVDLAETDEFRRLSLEHVSRLLASDELAVSREEEVWDIAMKWFQHDEDNRKSTMEILTKSIRFSLLSEQFVQESVLSHSVFCENEDHSSVMVEKVSALERRPSSCRRGSSKVLLAVSGFDGTVTEATQIYPSELTKTVEYHDPLSNVWKEFPSVNEGRYDSGVVTLGDSVYAVGGCDSHSVERYDYTKGRWVEDVPSMNCCHTGKTVLVYGDRIYAMDIAPEQYNPMTNTWTDLHPMSREVVVKGVVVLNDQIYLFGYEYDFISQYLSGVISIFKYDIVSDRWLDVSFFDCEAHWRFVCADGNCLHLWRENNYVFDHVRLDIRNGQVTSFEIKGCPSFSFLKNFHDFYETTYCLADGKEYSVGGVIRLGYGSALHTRSFFWYDMTKEVAEYVEGPSLINKRSKCGVGAIDRCLTFNLF